MKEELTVKLEINASGLRKLPTHVPYDSINKDVYVKNRMLESIPKSS
jgi:hypothetical protein